MRIASSAERDTVNYFFPISIPSFIRGEKEKRGGCNQRGGGRISSSSVYTAVCFLPFQNLQETTQRFDTMLGKEAFE